MKWLWLNFDELSLNVLVSFIYNAMLFLELTDATTHLLESVVVIGQGRWLGAVKMFPSAHLTIQTNLPYLATLQIKPTHLFYVICYIDAWKRRFSLQKSTKNQAVHDFDFTPQSRILFISNPFFQLPVVAFTTLVLKLFKKV